MRSMKQAAPTEADAIRRRALRSYAMDRIDKADCDYIVDLCDKIEARVVTMNERTERNEL